MPKFYIDYAVDSVRLPDEEGSELSGFEQARMEAAALLSEVASSQLPEVGRREFIATVRDAGGTARHRATLTFLGEDLTP